MNCLLPCCKKNTKLYASGNCDGNLLRQQPCCNQSTAVSRQSAKAAAKAKTEAKAKAMAEAEMKSMVYSASALHTSCLV